MIGDMKPYNIYIGWNNSAEGIILPVMPEKFELKKKGQGKTYDVLELGEINVIKARELAQISFESIFPSESNEYGFYSSEIGSNFKYLLSPEEYVKSINKWMESKYPVRFISTIPNLMVTLPMSIEQFDRWEVAGSGGDIEYRLTLKEYVFYSAQKMTVTEKDGKTVVKKEPPKRPDERVPPTTYTIKQGDTLLLISRLMLGDSGRWKEIQKLNGLSDAEVLKLQPGKAIKLPPPLR